MKNALILHGTDSGPDSNWFPWLKIELDKLGYEAWAPQLPDADFPDMKKYKDLLLESDFDFNEETLVIGHSSGAVAALHILQELKKPIDKAIMVASFRGDLGWDKLAALKDEPNYDKIKGKAKEIIFVHSDDDPYCPLEHPQYQAEQTDGRVVILPGQEHFSYESNPKHKQLPEILDLL